MERRSWCSPSWDIMEHGACDAHSYTHSCFSTTVQSSPGSLQTADYSNVNWQPLPADNTPTLHNMYLTETGDEMPPTSMIQYFPAPAPVTTQQPAGTAASMVASECSPMYHHHRQRKSLDPSSPKEDDEMPKRRREQNRVAQRAFRQRREENTRKLNDQLSRLIQEHQTLLEADSRQADEVQALKTQIAALDAKLEVLRRQRNPSSSASPTSEMFDGFLMDGGMNAGDQTSFFHDYFATKQSFDFTPRQY